jgi:hypothetical protein
MPKKGSVAEPGLVGVAAGIGTITWPPCKLKMPLMIGIYCLTVSVCQYVSTIGHRFWPTTSYSHFHAVGLIGSPTVPINLSEEQQCFVTISFGNAIRARTAVGAVYNLVTLYFSTIAHIREESG